MSLEKKHIGTHIKEYTLIALCALLLAFSYILFITPNDFAPAGLNGAAAMVQHLFGFSIGYFSLIVNIPLCIFACFFVTREFGIKSLVFSFIYSVAYLGLQHLDARFDLFSSVIYDAGGHDTIFPCIIAGVISGFVYGTCFRMNASTGGVDIVSKSISVKKPTINFFWTTFTINACVAFTSLFVYRTDTGDLSYRPVCLCMLYCFISSFMGNVILRGGKTAYQFIIVTPHSHELEAEILEKLHHSATRLHGEGIYSDSDREVLMCVVNKHQIVDVENILKKYPDTFAYVETVNQTFGNFKKIRK